MIEDPDELYNVIDDPRYETVVSKMKEGLLNETSKFSDTFFNGNGPILWNTPFCAVDSKNVINSTYNSEEKMLCSDLYYKNLEALCDLDPGVKRMCSASCSNCCKDSPGVVFIRENELLFCSNITQDDPTTELCKFQGVEVMCPESCGICNNLEEGGDIDTGR